MPNTMQLLIIGWSGIDGELRVDMEWWSAEQHTSTKRHLLRYYNQHNRGLLDGDERQILFYGERGINEL